MTPTFRAPRKSTSGTALVSRSVLRRCVAGTAIVASGLIVTPAAAYRTLADIDDFGDTEQVRWSENPVVFHGMGSLPLSLSERHFDAALEEAMSAWRYLPCSDQDVRFGGSRSGEPELGDGVNSIELVDTGWAERGFDPLATGFTDLDIRQRGGVWRIEEADIYVNADDFTWVWSDTLGVDERSLQSVLLHELGHAVGLAHPCEPNGADGAPACGEDADARHAAMYPLYDEGVLALSNDDVAGFCSLYATNCGDRSCAPGFECVDLECRVPCEGETCAIEERCVEGECVSDAPPEDCTSQRGDAGCEEPAEGTRSLGDPCSRSAQCGTGACSEDGYCAVPCTGDADCAADERCKEDAGGVCLGDQLPLGEACDGPSDCLGALCLDDSSLGDVCSRSCGEGEPSCPEDWSCQQVEEEFVCAPPSSDGGCGVARVSIRRGSPASWLGVGMVLVSMRWRRTRLDEPKVQDS